MGNILITILSFFSAQQTTFYNVEQLRRGTHGITAGMTISTQGFYTPNDGGSATYYVDNSGATEDSSTIIKIGSGSLRAKLLSSVTIDIRQLGGKMGTGLTDTQRKRNWKAMRQANGFCSVLEIPADTLQIFVSKNDSISVTRDWEIRGSGRGKSVISSYPKNRGYRGNIKLFYYRGGDLKINNCSLYGLANRWKMETYSAVIRPGGDVDAIQIPATPRAGFWTDLQNGDTLLVQTINSVQGFKVVVSSFNSGTKIIQTGTTFSTANDYTVASTYVARKWNSTATASNIATYSQSWNIADIEKIEVFFTEFGSGALTAQGNIVLDKVEVFGFDLIYSLSNFWGNAEIRSSKIQANTIAVAITGVNPSTPPNFRMIDSEMTDCGTLSVASTFDIAANNPTYGGGVYNHPGVPFYVNNCIIHNNSANAFRNFGSGYNSATGFFGYLGNCIFRDNDEQNLITSKAFPTIIENCEFHTSALGGGVEIGHSLSVSNCIINTAFAVTINSEPFESDTMRFKIQFSDCVFYENGQVSVTPGWNENQLNQTDVVIENCEFYPSATISPINFAYGNMTIKDCRVKVRRYPTLRWKDDNGTAFSELIVLQQTGGIDGEESGNIKIDNLQYDSVMLQTLFRVNSDTLNNTSIAITDSNIKATALSNSKTTPIEISNSVVYSGEKDGAHRIKSLPSKTQVGNVDATYTYYYYPFTAINKVLPYILRANVNGNTYLIYDSLIKVIEIEAENSDWDIGNSARDYVTLNPMYDGEINLLCAIDSFRLVPYGKDTLSNIHGNDTLTIYKGQTLKLKHYAQRCLAPTTTTVPADTIATANGTLMEWKALRSTTNYSSTPYVPGTMTLKTGGTTVAVDDGNGNWVGATVSGTINYLTRSYSIRFTTAPSNGTKIILAYNRYNNPIHAGYWSINW